MSKNSQTKLKLIGRELVAPLVDGHQILINDDGTEADILFFQIMPGTAKDGEISGIPVAHLRLSMAQLDAFIQNATKAKNDHSKKLTK